MTEANFSEIVDTEFWHMPLEDRMARFAELREIGPFLPISIELPMIGMSEQFLVTTRYAELVEISRRPDDFCSGRGAVSVPDLQAEALELNLAVAGRDDAGELR